MHSDPNSRNCLSAENLRHLDNSTKSKEMTADQDSRVILIDHGIHHIEHIPAVTLLSSINEKMDTLPVVMKLIIVEHLYLYLETMIW